MQARRYFFRDLFGYFGLAATVPFFNSFPGQQLLQLLESAAYTPAEILAQQEDFWKSIRQAYTVSSTLINLNNGGVSPQPLVVQQAVERYNKLSNETPSYYMWRVLDKGRERVREKLANLLGAKSEEIAINRNASEALETIIFGLRLKAGDEVVLSPFDYPNMLNAWEQRAHRDGIILKYVALDLPSDDEEAIIEAYNKLFTANTRVVHLTHLINWTGQILPVGKIARLARAKGIKVVVDAAHSFAHIPFQIDDLECDYLGTSLHKWLCAPFGSGMLFVKQENIAELYPLLAAPDCEATDIQKFEHLGTRSFAIEQAIAQAVDFHQMIGMQRKYERLQFLKTYWTDQVKDLDNIKFHTSLNPAYSAAIVLMQIEGVNSNELAKQLFHDYQIHVTVVKWEGLEGIRVTPNVYTTLEELDYFVSAIRELGT